MKNKFDYKEVFETLKIDIKNVVSLYKYAPVFKVKLQNEFYVLKRSKKDEMRFNKLMAYESHLISNDIKTVTPKKWLNKNSHMVGEDRWVLYPYVDGEPYNGSLDHIRKAGDLLGRLHKASNNTFNHGFSWSTYDDEFFSDIQEDYKNIIATYGENEVIRSWVNEAVITKFENLKMLELPYVDGVWDLKGSNLLYHDSVTLIDPDNSGYIPRVFDLSLALLLFNTESTLAPDRMFIKEEWDVFITSYSEHVILESVEKEIFHDFTKFVFLDEVLWAITDLEDDESQRQKDFMKNMLSITIEAFAI